MLSLLYVTDILHKDSCLLAFQYLVRGDWIRSRALFNILYILFVLLIIYGSHISTKRGYPGLQNMLKWNCNRKWRKYEVLLKSPSSLNNELYLINLDKSI